MDCIKLGERVRSIRKRRGLTQAQLAELTGYSVQHISHVETGMTKLSIDCIVIIANTLAVSLDYLLIDSLEKPQQKISEERWNELLSEFTEEEKELLYNINVSMKEHLLNYFELIGEKKCGSGND